MAAPLQKKVMWTLQAFFAILTTFKKDCSLPLIATDKFSISLMETSYDKWTWSSGQFFIKDIAKNADIKFKSNYLMLIQYSYCVSGQ